MIIPCRQYIGIVLFVCLFLWGFTPQSRFTSAYGYAPFLLVETLKRTQHLSNNKSSYKKKYIIYRIQFHSEIQTNIFLDM